MLLLPYFTIIFEQRNGIGQAHAMLKNNHIEAGTMNILQELEENFTLQPFEKDADEEQVINECLQIVKAYAKIDQSVAVMSDLAANKSYICSGSFGRYFDLSDDMQEPTVIDSIWEEEIYSRIHPDDLFERHLLELKFFHLLKGLPTEERLKYSTSCKIRAFNTQQECHYINHRTLYLRSTPNNSLWLALCLYNFSNDQTPQLGISGRIVNNETGEVMPLEQYNSCSKLLTKRETEVLQHVSQGLLSKEISERMGISLNTVNRHRQNILEKLNVKNSMEAVKTAMAINLI